MRVARATDEDGEDWRSDLHRARSTSFGRSVGAYAAARPSYPDEAVAWLVPDDARDVVDLGAGTGKLTAGLAARGNLRVTAVEPDDLMRGALAAALPTVTAVAGTAEGTGLPDASADLVAVGQAWHWFDSLAATREVRRVLRRGGRLALVWNVVLEGELDWADAYFEIVHRGDTLDYSRTQDPAVGPGLGPWERASFSWRHHPARRAAAARREPQPPHRDVPARSGRAARGGRCAVAHAPGPGRTAVGRAALRHALLARHDHVTAPRDRRQL